MPQYSDADISRMYDEIRVESFPDIFAQTSLVIKDIRVFGYSSPFRPRIYINIDELNKYAWPEEAVRGLLAHELAHQVSYKRRSLPGRYLFVWNYLFSVSGKARVEREADLIVIERGRGNELVQERIHQFEIDDQKRLDIEKRVYLSADELGSAAERSEAR